MLLLLTVSVVIVVEVVASVDIFANRHKYLQVTTRPPITKQSITDAREGVKTKALITAPARGGGGLEPATSRTSSYLATSTIVWGPGGRLENNSWLRPGVYLSNFSLTHSSSSSSSTMIAPTWIGEGQWGNENTPPLWKALAFLSDITILVLETRTPVDGPLVDALESGFQARLKDLPKGRLLVVLQAEDPKELAAWKDQLTKSLSGAQGRIVEELDIVPASQFEKSLASMQRRVRRQVSKGGAGGVSELADADTFPSLVQQVFRAFGGGKMMLLRETNVSLSTAHKRHAEHHGPIRNDNEKELETALFAEINEQLDELQVKQEENWLDSSGAAMPINFSAQANSILSKAEQAIRDLPTVVQESVQKLIQKRIRQLYIQQLEALRDQHGKMYETTLDRMKTSELSPASFKDAAAKVTEQFRKAAQHATPTLVQTGEIFEDSELHYHRTLAESGLISDMMEAIDLRQDLFDIANMEVESEPSSSRGGLAPYSSSRRRLTKWYEKLAAKALVIGVNYLQGWLAWQGIKRAALLREQRTPKFPLF